MKFKPLVVAILNNTGFGKLCLNVNRIPHINSNNWTPGNIQHAFEGIYFCCSILTMYSALRALSFTF